MCKWTYGVQTQIIQGSTVLQNNLTIFSFFLIFISLTKQFFLSNNRSEMTDRLSVSLSADWDVQSGHTLVAEQGLRAQLRANASVLLPAGLLSPRGL